MIDYLVNTVWDMLVMIFYLFRKKLLSLGTAPLIFVDFPFQIVLLLQEESLLLQRMSKSGLVREGKQAASRQLMPTSRMWRRGRRLGSRRHSKQMTLNQNKKLLPDGMKIIVEPDFCSGNAHPGYFSNEIVLIPLFKTTLWI